MNCFFFNIRFIFFYLFRWIFLFPVSLISKKKNACLAIFFFNNIFFIFYQHFYGYFVKFNWYYICLFVVHFIGLTACLYMFLNTTKTCMTHETFVKSTTKTTKQTHRSDRLFFYLYFYFFFIFDSYFYCLTEKRKKKKIGKD